MPLLMDAKRYQILKDVPTDLVAALNAITERKTLPAGAEVYHEGDAATIFYFLVRGKALFVNEPRADMSVALGAIKPGGCFGWTAVLPGELYKHTVVCSEECEILALDGEKMRRVLADFGCQGYTLMRNLLALVNDRLNLRTSQLLKFIEDHPDFKAGGSTDISGAGY